MRVRATLRDVVAWARWGNLAVTEQSPVGQVGSLGEESQDVSRGCHSRLLQALLPQDLDQEVDVSHCQAKRFILAQLLVWRVSGDELPQPGKGSVHILLPPPLPGVCADLARHVWDPGQGKRKSPEGQHLIRGLVGSTGPAKNSRCLIFLTQILGNSFPHFQVFLNPPFEKGRKRGRRKGRITTPCGLFQVILFQFPPSSYKVIFIPITPLLPLEWTLPNFLESGTT